ncbi:MAG: fibronectin type III domain-containing protein [Verrucomicrobia bacterium]|nr:fibronectin type III domain-containing protein [Verrucomicrobiota bacterium]
MKQKIPGSMSGLLSATNTAIEAGTSLSATVALAHNTPAAFTVARGAAVVARDARELGKEELRILRELAEIERNETREFVMLGRDQLKPTLGRLYHPGWDITGFQGTLQAPNKPDKLESFAEAFHSYLVQNPTKEVPAHDITAVKADERYNAIKNARTAVLAKEGELKTLKQNRDAKFAVLAVLLRGLVKELGQLIPPLDGRWTTFGFNTPGVKERPPTPTNIKVVLIGPNALSVKWDRSARAEYYRVWMRIVGVGTELGVVGTPADLDMTLESLPSNSIVEVALSAMNNGGESARSEVIAVQTL